MSTVSEIEVIIGASGAEAVVSQLQAVQSKQQEIKQGGIDAGAGFQSMGEGAGGALGSIGDLANTLFDIPLDLAAIVGGVGAVVAAWGQLMEISEEGAGIGRVFESGALAAQAYGLDMEDVLGQLRETSLGTVSDLDLTLAASKAMMLGIGGDTEKLSQLLEIAALRGRMMGVDMTKSFNDIVLGLGRASPKILDNLGIVIDTNAAFEDYAESVGKAADELTKAEKTQAMLNAVIESSQPLLAAAGGLTVDTAGKWEAMHAAKANYFNTLKMELAEATSWWADYWAGVFREAAEEHATNKNVEELWEQAKELNLVSDEMMLAYHRIAFGYVEDGIVHQGQGKGAFFLQYRDEILALIDATEVAVNGTTDWAEANYEGAGGVTAATAAVEKQTLKLKELNAAQEAYEKTLEALADANLELDIAVQTFHESVGDKLVKGLRDAGLEGEELEKRLGILDGIMGTSYVMEYKMELAVDDLLETLINDPEAFKAEFAAFDDAFTPLQDSVKAAMSDVALLEGQLLDLEREYDIILNILVNGSIPSVSGGNISINSDWEIDPFLKALGGPVYPDETYLIGERGAELFVPDVPGTILSNSDYRALLSGSHTTGSLEIDYKKLGKAITDSLVEAADEGRLGNTVVINNDGRRENVASNYELLRAYGGNF